MKKRCPSTAQGHWPLSAWQLPVQVQSPSLREKHDREMCRQGNPVFGARLRTCKPGTNWAFRAATVKALSDRVCLRSPQFPVENKPADGEQTTTTKKPHKLRAIVGCADVCSGGAQ